MTTQPKSIRLNKKHREQIVASVMQEWDKNNPKPAASEIDLFKALYSTLCNPAPDAADEYKTFVRMLEQTRAVNEVLESVPDACKGLVELNRYASAADLKIVIRKGDNGETWLKIMIPKAVADELEIPYIRTFQLEMTSEYARANHSECIPYIDSNGMVEMVVFATTNNVVFVQDCDAVKQHSKLKREAALWENQRASMKEELADFLDQFTTTAQLREQWPEVVDFLPAPLADPTAVIKLPAIAVSRLNERLGLG